MSTIKLQQSLPVLFREQASRTPDAPAVSWNTQRLTYKELDEQSDALANYLQAAGVSLEMPVGICLNRSAQMIVTMLAILKAGGTCLPMDPSYPRARLLFMLEDANCTLVIVEPQTADRLGPSSARTVQFDKALEAIPVEPLRPACSLQTGENRAFILYTSGSTGQPKGVEILHKGIIRLVVETDYVKFHERDRVSQLANICFDAVLFEVWGALLHGAHLIGVPSDVLLSPPAMARFIQRHGLTLMFLPTALFHVLASEAPHAFRPVRYLIFGGEVASAACIRSVRAAAPRTQLVNGYGPTEATTFAVAYAVNQLEGDVEIVPIGRPINQTDVHILDTVGQAVAPGESGELFISGNGVARGYLNRPGLTAQRFIELPTNGGPQRAYRTGDLVRQSSSGDLEFVGRIDRQIKIRGFRIEPEELEAVLLRHPSVRECVVDVQIDAAQQVRLLAYVVAARAESTNAAPVSALADRLQAYLRETVPEFMVPTRILILDKFPLNANGKVDRRALLPPDTGAAAQTAPALPRTGVELAISDIFAQVLGVRRLGVNDDFLALGGHSLQVAQVLSQVREKLKVELPVSDLYATSTAAGLAARIEALTPDRETSPASAHHASADRLPQLPLSASQRQMWFHSQLTALPIYNESIMVMIRAPVAASALHDALSELTQRHEILRTVYRKTSGEAVQEILSQMKVELQQIDLRPDPIAGRYSDALRLASEFAARPFDLEMGPLLRAFLFCIDTEEHLLLLSVHHIAVDRISLQSIVLPELAEMYRARVDSRGPNLPPVEQQYADILETEIERLGSGLLDQQLSYWQQRFGEGVPSLPLPADRSHAVSRTFRGAKHVFTVPVALTSGLKALAQQERVTLFMMLMAAFKLLLYRYSAQEEIGVGTVHAARLRPGLNTVVGPLFNYLLLYGRLRGSQTVRELIEQSRAECVAAYENSDYPFDLLVARLRPQRQADQNAFFQVALVLYPQAVELPANWMLMPWELDTGTAKTDLTLFVNDQQDSLQLCFQYSTELFDLPTIERMSRQLSTVMETMIAEPNQRLSEVALLTPAEQQKLIVDWNVSQPVPCLNQCFHERFAAQTLRTPDTIAIQRGDESLTYAALHRQSNQLAHWLGLYGIGAGSVVGICMPSSPSMLVAILAVWKSGAAYVPVDANHPKARLQFMMQDANVHLLISHSELIANLPSWGIPILSLDREWTTISRCETTDLLKQTTASALAYVLYTSGSTGRPKGVLISHANLGAMIDAVLALFPMRVETRVLQFSSFGFDASVFELVVSLLQGGTLIMAERSSLVPGAELSRLLREQSINFAVLLPSVLMAIPEGEYPALHTILAAAEPCSAEVVARWAPNRRLFNGYGPTEATVISTMAECVDPAEAPSIGRPVPNVQVFVLDAGRKLVPIGVPGELYIGGPTVSQGYLNRPELTAARFLASPFSSCPGLLYKTGDVVKWRSDGCLDFLGRVDRQIKIRGHRIEPEEIETLLQQHEAVSEVAIHIHESQRGAQQLVAYVVQNEWSDDELRVRLSRWLKERLPSIMVPSIYVGLATMPLLPSGKVDRKALPPPRCDTLRGDPPSLERDEIESSLASIWQELLQLSTVGREDNFFDLGGHSMLLGQMQHQIQSRLGLDVPLTHLFRYPTIEALACVLRAPQAQVPAWQKETARTQQQRSAAQAMQRRARTHKSAGGGTPKSEESFEKN